MDDKHFCPVCGHELKIKKVEEYSGMDGRYRDWLIRCDNCFMLEVTYAADNFYDRDYFETPEEAWCAFERDCEKFKSPTLGVNITEDGIIYTATGNAAQAQRRGKFLGEAAMYERIEKELLHEGLISDKIREVLRNVKHKWLTEEENEPDKL